MAESFGVEDRGHFYDPVGALRDVVVNHLMQVVAAAAMEAPSRRRPGHDEGLAGRALPRDQGGRSGPLRPRAVRRLSRDRRRRSETRRPRPTPRCGSRSTTGAGPACRSSSAPASACRRRRPRLRLVFKHPPTPRVSIAADRQPEPTSSSSSSIRRRASASMSTRTAPMPRRRERSSSTWSSPQEGGEGPTPYEVLLHAALVGDSTRFTRQDGVEETWRIMQPLLDEPAAGAPVRARELGARRKPTSSSPAMAAGTDHGWPHERNEDTPQRQKDTAPGRRARPRPRRSRRSRTTPSCPTATPARWSRPTARSTGCASRASTRRASFGSLLDREAGFFRFGPFGIDHPDHARSTCRARTCSRRRGRRRPAGSSSGTR